jgi:hypothetical protein
LVKQFWGALQASEEHGHQLALASRVLRCDLTLLEQTR